jgi:hypothetical protein
VFFILARLPSTENWSQRDKVIEVNNFIKKMKKEFLFFYVSVLIFIIILAVLTWPVMLKMTKLAYGPVYGTDNRSEIRDLWFMRYSFQHKIDFYDNNFTNYPFYSAFKGYSFLPYWLTPKYILSIIFNEFFSYNFILLSSFVLSFIGAYWLVFYLTKNYFSAFACGLIYSFTPYHFHRAWEHYSLTFIDFFPFALLFLIRIKEKPIFKNILFGAFFILLVSISDLSYAFIMAVFLVCFFFYAVFFNFRNKVSAKENIQFIKGFFYLFLLVILFVAPAIVPVIKQMFFAKPLIAEAARIDFVRPFKYLFSHSARPFNYLLPSYAHPVFGQFTKSMFGSIFYGRGYLEQTLYLGWVSIIFAFLAIKKYKFIPCADTSRTKCSFYFQIKFLIFLTLAGFLFSLPPYIDLFFLKIYLPSFFLYKIIPMFRAYARFGILLILATTTLAGFGIAWTLDSFKNNPIKKNVLKFLVVIFILFEFNNIPPLHCVDLNSNIPLVYSWLKNQPDDFGIIEYPLKKGDTSEGYANLDYLLFQRVHQKKIFDATIPQSDALKIREKVSNLASDESIALLKLLGLKYVIVHLADYGIGEEPLNLSRFHALKLLKKIGSDEIYEL